MNGFALPLVRLSLHQHASIIGHCYKELPNEACGLLLGPAVGGDDLHDGEPTGAIADVVTTRNEAASARLYAIHGQDYGTARKAARESGNRIVGCFHSHTHTDAYPSPTDVEAAIHNPNWLYAIVSLRDETPMLHVFRMQSGNIAECQVVLEAR